MKKIMKVTGKILLGLLAVIVLFFSGVFIWDKVAAQVDKNSSVDYGQKVDVFGNKMNVVITGSAKEKETIVLLTGFGTVAPALDFEPLVDELKDDFNIVAIEPFGYGMSESSKRPRTKENIVEEIHEVTRILEIDSFIAMGHSFAGIYMLNYVNTYPGQVKAVIGIDTSVPEQLGVEGELPITLMNFMRVSGLARFSTLFSEKPVTETDKLKAYVQRNNGLSKSLVDEGKHMDETLLTSQGVRFPKDLPVLLFVATATDGVTNWFEMHENQIERLPKAKMQIIDGTHYLHHEHSALISKETKAFLALHQI